MHSRAFTLVRGIVSESYLKTFIYTDEETVYDKIEICDGVRRDDDIFENWKWLLNCYGSFISGKKVNDNYTITVNLKKLEEYFEGKNQKLKELVEKLNTKSWRYLAEDNVLYGIETTIDDRTGFYIICGDDKWRETDTFSTWLTVVYSALLDEKLDEITFTIVETFDYHS